MKKFVILLAMFLSSYYTFAQKSKANDTNKAKNIIIVETYSCPMHPDVTSDKPGKCSKCGMDLLLSKKELLKREVVKLYSCATHTEVVSNSPGKCPKCGSDLLLSKKEQLKREVVKLYSCPMHPDMVTDSSGRCPKCGMDLVGKQSSSNEKSN
ncbi:MAG: heavy metal-binding domain-containing protein [Panacibacter sp.]